MHQRNIDGRIGHEMLSSFIYRRVWIYRLAMTVLYRGSYRARFDRMAALLTASERSVLELCFGDTVFAELCRRQGRTWTGLDVNERFVARAAANGYDAHLLDLRHAADLPTCDVCVMIGSLYHFHAQLPELFERIKAVSGRFLISEPVQNWTHGNALLRGLARRGTRVGPDAETFRFNEASLRASLEALRGRVGFRYRVIHVARDMIVEVLWSS